MLKKTVHDELVKKANDYWYVHKTDTSNFVKKTDYVIKIAQVEKEILDHEDSNKQI